MSRYWNEELIYAPWEYALEGYSPGKMVAIHYKGNPRHTYYLGRESRGDDKRTLILVPNFMTWKVDEQAGLFPWWKGQALAYLIFCIGLENWLVKELIVERNYASEDPNSISYWHWDFQIILHCRMQVAWCTTDFLLMQQHPLPRR